MAKKVMTKKMEKTLPMILQWDESFDIGVDMRVEEFEKSPKVTIKRLFPDGADYPLAAQWAGLRPMTPKGNLTRRLRAGR
jgi:glycine/D-amino acid oxidase-like deaminating enzyme